MENETTEPKLGLPVVDDAYRVKSDQSTSGDSEFTPDEQRAILRRIDYRLVTTVGFMYCVSLMDRTNLGAANIAGMSTELVLSGNRYVSSLTLGDMSREAARDSGMELPSCILPQQSVGLLT